MKVSKIHYSVELSLDDLDALLRRGKLRAGCLSVRLESSSYRGLPELAARIERIIQDVEELSGIPRAEWDISDKNDLEKTRRDLC